MIKKDLEYVSKLAINLQSMLEENPNLSGYSADEKGKAALEFILDELFEIGHFAEMEAENMK